MSNKSSISVGEIIRQVLEENTFIKSKVTEIYPVQNDAESVLPYIVYRRSGMSQTPVKTGRGADSVVVQICVFSEEYADGADIAEAVRESLDGAQNVHLCTSFDDSLGEDFGLVNDVLTMRSCMLSDCSEAWSGDAFVQNLIFNIKL